MKDGDRQRLTCALILFSATGVLSQMKPIEFRWENAKGTVVDPMEFIDAPQQSYALYLPSSYSPDRRWPVIYAFDPNGQGERAVEAYKGAEERYGYIVAASNNSRNGPGQTELAAAEAVWKDTHRRFSIDAYRVYTTGFSGGAKAATYFALYCYTCHVAGVIAQGAGYPALNSSIAPANDHFAYYAVIGEDDLNIPDVMALRRKKDEQGEQFKVEVYPGSHQWAPGAVVEDAVAWMELKAMQSRVEKVDAEFVQKMFEQTQADAAKGEKAGDVLGQYYALRSVAWDFKGLEEVRSFESELPRVKASEAWKKANLEEQEQIDLQRMFTLRSAPGYRDKHFKLSNFAALGEFSLRDYRGREMGKRFGEAYIEGVEQGFGRGAWRGDAETGSLSFYLHFHCAQHLELSEAFFDG
jgi:dienelactone hydrolase